MKQPCEDYRLVNVVYAPSDVKIHDIAAANAAWSMVSSWEFSDFDPGEVKRPDVDGIMSIISDVLPNMRAVDAYLLAEAIQDAYAK